jgi:hypothetical protein
MGTILLLNEYDFVKEIEAIQNENFEEFKRLMQEFIKECDGIEGVQECFGLDEYIDDIKEQLYYDSDSDDGDYYYVDLITFSVGKITVKTEKTVRVSDLIW